MVTIKKRFRGVRQGMKKFKVVLERQNLYKWWKRSKTAKRVK